MKRALPLLVAVLLSTTLAAQKPAEVELGFKSNRVFDFSSVDSVNVFSGNVVIDIPIGLRYPVSSHLSYGLKLVYNGKIWDYRTRFKSDEDRAYQEAQPNHRSNAGPGWRLSLGRLIEGSDSTFDSFEGFSGWLYEGPAGDEHQFWSIKYIDHFTNPYTGQTEQNDPNAVVLYSADETRLRMTYYASQNLRVIEFPDGSKQSFQLAPHTKWRLTKMEDAFGNAVEISYSYNTDSVATDWKLTDNHNRQHKVSFQFNSDMADSIDEGMIVSSISFGSLVVNNQPTAPTHTYTFAYTTTPVDYGCFHTWTSQVADEAPSGTRLPLPLLTSISQPDGSTYSFDYETADSGKCEQGLVKSLKLPTKGVIGYTYQVYRMPQDGCDPEGPQSQTPGIRTRTIDGSTTTYLLTLSAEAQGTEHDVPLRPCPDSTSENLVTPNFPHRWRRTSIISPVDTQGFHTRSDHYFNAWRTPVIYFTDPTYHADDAKFIYPEPLTTAYVSASASQAPPADEPDATVGGVGHSEVSAADASGTRHLSEQFWDRCAANGDCTNGTLLRSTYRRPDNLGSYFNVEHKVVSERVVYHDDTDAADDVNPATTEHADCGGTCYTQTDFSDYDQIGHFRRTTRTSNFPGVQSETQFRSYFTWASNSAIAAQSSWVLSRYRSDERTIGNDTATREYHFSDSGQLLKERAWAGASRGARDLLSVFTYETTAGNPQARKGDVTKLSSYGGDNQSLGTDALDTLVLPPTAEYANLYTWSFGGLATTKQENLPLSYFASNYSIDQKTGLVTTATGSDGLTTAYAYKAWGQLESVTPPGLVATTYSVTNASDSGGVFSPATIVEKRDPITGMTTDDVTTTYEYDKLGRLQKTKRTIPNLGCVEQRTEYDARGRTYRQSTQKACGENPTYTTYIYDGQDRTLSITTPDGRSTTFTYRGVRETQTSREVGLATISTLTSRDMLGRLTSVEEAIDYAATSPHGTGHRTDYSYDTGDRLVTVRMHDGAEVQERTFTYDNRGLLLYEVHPEFGSAGYGRKSYQYDSRAHVTQVTTGTGADKFTVVQTYDAGERPRQTLDETLNGTVLVDRMYDYDPRPGGCATAVCLGKLVATARNNNDADDSGSIAPVYEKYGYDTATGGANRREVIVGIGVANQPVVVQSQTYDSLGNVSTLSYPCVTTSPGNCGSHALTVTPSYTNGLVSSVVTGPGITTSLSYAPHGGVSQVTHTGFGTAIRTFDAMGRIFSITARTPTNVVVWPSGSYAYDGTGNVTAIGATSYHYDSLNRLFHWQTGSFGSTFKQERREYDEFGNYRYSSFSGCQATIQGCYASQASAYKLSGTTNHYELSTYDVAGNVTADALAGATRTYAFDKLASMTHAHDVGVDFHYVYTADGERVAAIDRTTGKITYTLRGFDNKLLSVWSGNLGSSTTTWKEDTVWAGNELLGRNTPTGNYRYVTDHLGSPRAIFASNGSLVGIQDFQPFGGGGTSNGGTLQFTGHERDSASLTAGAIATLPDYMHARFYAATSGRFLSVDPVINTDQAIHNPQGWNRYAYVMNNPVRFTDPDGRECGGCAAFERDVRDLAAGKISVDEYNARLEARGNGALLGLTILDGVGAARGLFALGVRLFAREGAEVVVEAGAKKALVQVNKEAGDAFRDQVAAGLKAEGRPVKTEVVKRTPFGKRVIDIEVSQNGRVLGGIETKVGKSPYTPSQRAKDWWLRKVEDYIVNLVRSP